MSRKLTPVAIAAAQSTLAELQNSIPTEVITESSLKKIFGDTLNIASAFTHPTFELMETFATLAWFINEVTKASKVVSLSAAGALAATAFVEQFCFVTISQLEKTRENPFSCEQKNAVLTAFLNTTNFIGCIAEGLKFSAGMYGTLSQGGSELSITKKIFIASVGAFRFSKERMVVFEAAKENLKKFGFASDAVDAFFNKVPVINGKVYLIDIQHFITSNQPVIEGALHGLAIYTWLKEMAGMGKTSLVDMMKENFGATTGIMYASLVAASGEKAAQRYDAEKAFIAGHRTEVTTILHEIAREKYLLIPSPDTAVVQINEDPEQRLLPSQETRNKSSYLAWLNLIPRALTTVGNVVGGVASKAVDAAALMNPLYWFFPVAGHKAVKIAGNIAFGLVGSHTVVNTPGAFQPKNEDLIRVIEIIFPTFSGLAAFAQWNARQSGIDHIFAERYGQGKTVKEKMTHAAKELFYIAPKSEEEESRFHAVWNSFYKSFVPGADAVTKNELSDVINKFAKYCSDQMNLQTSSEVRADIDLNRITSAIITACVENPDLATQLVLMNRAVMKMIQLNGDSTLESAHEVFQKETKQIISGMHGMFKARNDVDVNKSPLPGDVFNTQTPSVSPSSDVAGHI